MSVVPVAWVGFCDACDEPGPQRDSAEQAQQDIAECPCRYEMPEDDK